ncbi:cysteine--tRNA (Cys) ligase [Parastagonospora nodorum]|nr:cysteine--tRNA (Cys) ligase [Parastagonospora nodorum]KAH4985266.1 cysteine--tRNA (Cys) ligase [Parastagonospora nodorum]KAH5306552.1 cysteine--tRNA (Cys) ligase [Parastagonospora nodorum]KAH5499042.1 cysteine--tRNA (Cys) ligase [Parastagonospora nodorum]KAH6003359.1 cysteine--tRNA (Cys) ligase [Parastagonospora nodorum]
MVLGLRSLSRQIFTTSSPLARKRNNCTNPLRLTIVATMATSTRTQPPWKEPKSSHEAKLKVWNSLTRSKNEFVPVDPEGKVVKWYSCGPTVYDDAHLGHARNYVTIDILRRVLAGYFGYNLRFVQNITDVDDKIILRGRQQYLLADFKSKNPTVTDELINTTIKAFDAYVKKNLPLLSAEVNIGTFNEESAKQYANVIQGKSVDGVGIAGDKEAKIKMHLRTAGTAATALLAPSKTTPEDVEAFYAGAEDVLLPYLDSLYGTTIDASDHTVFTRLTQKYEARFNEDMRSLNVLDPNVVTRVTEYGDQIVTFVEKIVANGFAYSTSDGSVYFDIEAFEKVPGNHYARLEPWNRGDKSLQADGEGALSQQKTSEKRSESDFALWKSSKPGEPAWKSPWGPGRPGWHIECSVMASDVLGEQMDIHSGGIDLCFPHHDNELAQSEAHWSSKEGGHQWVNYFLHMGHLSISGSKMSKSLKNFTTIREALARGDWNARSLRIIFLLGGWHDGIEITDDMRKGGASWESYVTNFFYKVRDLEVHPNIASTGAEDEKVRKAFDAAKEKVHNALADSFDTPAAMRAISSLITDYNSADKAGLSDDVSFDVARYITRMVRIFGLDGSADPYDGGIGWAGIDIPSEAKEFVYAVSRDRDEVRKHAVAGDLSGEVLEDILAQHKPAQKQEAAAVPYAEVLSTFQENLRDLAAKNAPTKDFLALCDQLRDTHLWDLGIYLEDRENAPAMVRPVDAELQAARTQKEAIARAKAEAKAKREAEEAEKKAKQAEQAKINPKDMFRTAEYSAWDDEGLPTKDAKGEEVTKGKSKKLKKEWEKQKKLFEEHAQSA